MNSLSGSTGYRGATGSNLGKNSGSLQGGGSGDIVPKGYKKGQMQNFTPEMMELFRNAIEQLGPDSFLARLAGGDQSMFDEMEAPAMRQFSELQGGLASRFSGMGMGGRKSSGFQNTMNSAASNFAQDLQAKRMDYRRQALQDLMGNTNQLLQQRPYENYMIEKAPKDKGFNWQGLTGGVLGAAGGFFAGGPAGAVTGANVGYNAGSAFH